MAAVSSDFPSPRAPYSRTLNTRACPASASAWRQQNVSNTKATGAAVFIRSLRARSDEVRNGPIISGLRIRQFANDRRNRASRLQCSSVLITAHAALIHPEVPDIKLGRSDECRERIGIRRLGQMMIESRLAGTTLVFGLTIAG